MDEKDLELLKARCRYAAAESVLATLCKVMGRLDSAFPQSLLQMANQWRQIEIQRVTFPDQSPEYSDLLAGELQEAVDALLKRMADGTV